MTLSPDRSPRPDVTLLPASVLALLLLPTLVSTTLHYYDGHPLDVLLGSFTAFFAAVGATGLLMVVIDMIKVVIDKIKGNK